VFVVPQRFSDPQHIQLQVLDVGYDRMSMVGTKARGFLLSA
jgi:hypothetical protein